MQLDMNIQIFDILCDMRLHKNVIVLVRSFVIRNHEEYLQILSSLIIVFHMITL